MFGRKKKVLESTPTPRRTIVPYPTRRRREQIQHQQQRAGLEERRLNSQSGSSVTAVAVVPQPSIGLVSTTNDRDSNRSSERELRRRSLPIDSSLLSNRVESASKVSRDFSSSIHLQKPLATPSFDSSDNLLEETQDSLVPATPIAWNLWDSRDSDSDQDDYSENDESESDDGTESDSSFESEYFSAQSTQHTEADVQEIPLQTVMAAEVPPMVQPPNITFIGSKVKIQRDFDQAVAFINQHPNYFPPKHIKKIKTSLKHVKKVLLEANGTISSSKTKSIWTHKISTMNDNLTYLVSIETQLKNDKNKNNDPEIGNAVNLEKDAIAKQELFDLEANGSIDDAQKASMRQIIIDGSHNIIGNAKNNGTAAQYESLRRHYATKRGREEVKILLAEWLAKNHERFRQLVGDSAGILTSENVVIWDTESDGVGGTHALEKTREWGFRKLASGVYTSFILTPHLQKYSVILQESLHLKRGDLNLKQRLLTFLSGASYLIAFEPKGCDRNRLQELLTPNGIQRDVAKVKGFSPRSLR
ncbi:hypothetical protein HK100_003572 [Physocladia obscura]|uniref:Uncharacterized protein n=1 Tax=Physocladia obscura TaxID=109957 RepID=A0AAD5SU60_9FUNG|nr:hypothetical protein HK100_003572 [Physocladia obscura]